jgi:type II secretory pathway pseudopilin PulG
MVRPQLEKQGFSLLELLICMAVMMVVTVAAIPTISRTLQVVKLQSSAQDFATLLQRARILAVKNNTTYSIVVPGVANGIQIACIDSISPPNGACDATEPMVALSGNVSLVTDGSGPSTNQITCGPLTTACPAGFTGLNFAPQAANAFASYNDRGLPCVGNPATTEPSGTICNERDPTLKPVGFLFVFQYAGANARSYSAVTVTPSGLVSEWSYNGSSWGQQ